MRGIKANIFKTKMFMFFNKTEPLSSIPIFSK